MIRIVVAGENLIDLIVRADGATTPVAAAGRSTPRATRAGAQPPTKADLAGA